MTTPPSGPHPDGTSPAPSVDTSPGPVAERAPVRTEPARADLFDPDAALAEVRSQTPSAGTVEAVSHADLTLGTSETLPVPEPVADTEVPAEVAPEPDYSAHPGFETADDPRIPQHKQFFKIGEVATITGLKPYVLRYWETEFSWVRPSKTSSRQRLYRRQDVALLLQIKRLRYVEKHTIASAKEFIRRSRRPSTRRSKKSSKAKAAPQAGLRQTAPMPNGHVVSPAPAMGNAGVSGDVAAGPVFAAASARGNPNAQLGLGFPTVSRTAELARRLAEMRRSVLDLLDAVKE